MPVQRVLDKMSAPEREECERRLTFIQEHLPNHRGLATQVAQITGYSKTQVSLTFSGKSINPTIVQEAFRQISLKQGAADPAIADSLGPLLYKTNRSASLVQFLARFNRLQEMGNRITHLQAQIIKMIQELQSIHTHYGPLHAESVAAFEKHAAGLPDAGETLIRETLLSLPAPDFYIPDPSANPEEQLPGESDIDFAIRQLKRSGDLRDDGHLTTDSYDTSEEFQPGLHVDEETGQTYVLGRD